MHHLSSHWAHLRCPILAVLVDKRDGTIEFRESHKYHVQEVTPTAPTATCQEFEREESLARRSRIEEVRTDTRTNR
jgi:hypothetical protein